MEYQNSRQPPNSPDFNVLDLGFFRAIQTLQLEWDIRGTGELIEDVLDAFDAMKHCTLNAVFLTLQKVYECTMEANGANDFRIPHMRKKKTTTQK